MTDPLPTIPSLVLLLGLAGSAMSAETHASEHMTTLHGHKLYYESYGRAQSDKPTLVLVHGWASSTWAWHRQLPALSGLGRVLVVDLLLGGKGASRITLALDPLF